MKQKTLLTTLILTFNLYITAQTISDFEMFELDSTGFLNGSDLNGGFTDGNIFLPNSYDQTYESWLGWSITNHTDTSTPGFTNQYSAISGSGTNGSENYAISFSFGPNTLELVGDAAGKKMGGMFITNSTYAYLSMRDGDSFAKKFGGASGDDPDYFLLTIKGIVNNETTADSINFYLADYRFDDNNADYIIDEWTYVDLNSLGEVDAISLSLSSSDNGQFGMNTPAFFCVDDIKTTDGSTMVKYSEEKSLKVYPNPFSDVIYLNQNFGVLNYEILSLAGQSILLGKMEEENHLDLSFLQQGPYLLRFWNESIQTLEFIFKD